MAGKLEKKTPAIVDAFDRGTAKTRKRLKRETTLDRMMRERRRAGHRDTSDLERAAREIQRIYFYLTARLFVRTSTMEKLDRGTGLGRFPPDWMLDAYLNRYLPFIESVKHISEPVFSIIIDVVIEDHSLRDIEVYRNLRRGRASKITLDGLKLYSDLSRSATRRVLDSA